MYFAALENLIQLFASLPGIGRRSATRIAFHLLRMDDYLNLQLSEAVRDIRKHIRFCKECGGLSEAELCKICEDANRNDEILCVVEEPGDIYAIEKTGEYKGRYHVLMGALSPLDGIGPEDLRIQELAERVEKSKFVELLVAANPTLEGDATAQYLLNLFRDKDIRITRISHGLPTGATIEFADSSALSRSIRSRQELQ